MSDIDENDDNAGGYTLEEYDVGPTQQQQAAAEVSNLDFRMDAPPPSAGDGSMEQRLRGAADLAPPEGMQLARPAPGCCAPGEGSTHTGPKAVKADYEAAKQSLREKRMMADLQKERTMQPQKRVTQADLQMSAEEKAMLAKANKLVRTATALTHCVMPLSLSLSPLLSPPPARVAGVFKWLLCICCVLGVQSDEDSEDEDDAAFEKYKQERIAFVQNSLSDTVQHGQAGDAASSGTWHCPAA